MNIESKAYQTAEAFRKALEARLNQSAQSQGTDLARLRRMVAFERLLARIFQDEHPQWLLKGGYAMELRLREKARATRDLDLSVPDPALIAGGGDQVEAVREKLREEALKDIGDWFQFFIGDAREELDAAPYGGARFMVESRLAAREFTKFHLDVGLGDAVVSEPEWVKGHDLLAFAGIPPARIALLPREQQFAEKLHAYTLPRGGNLNSRVRDLIDLVLLIEQGLPDAPVVFKAVRATFHRRRAHPVPEVLEPPPQTWEGPFSQLAEDIGLDHKQARSAFEVLFKFWEKLRSEKEAE